MFQNVVSLCLKPAVTTAHNHTVGVDAACGQMMEMIARQSDKSAVAVIRLTFGHRSHPQGAIRVRSHGQSTGLHESDAEFSLDLIADLVRRARRPVQLIDEREERQSPQPRHLEQLPLQALGTKGDVDPPTMDEYFKVARHSQGGVAS